MVAAPWHWDQGSGRVAVRYVSGLDVAMRNLCKTPSIGSNYGEVVEGVQRYRFKSHYLYYIVSRASGSSESCIFG
jgi:plasmid stabilization system protein ParE